MNNPETLMERLRRHSQTVDLAGYHAVATDVLEAADYIDTLTARLREVEEALTDIRIRGLLLGLRSHAGAVVKAWDEPTPEQHGVLWWRHEAVKVAEKGLELADIIEALSTERTPT